MDIRHLIDIKKRGGSLSQEQIFSFITALSQNKTHDSQVSALLMAILLKGMTAEETYFLTSAMKDSGDVIDTSFAGGLVCDKHSTGGVSDTVTPIIVPILAEAGLKIVKLSGRGLSHTGGTIDKLESIPGFKTELSTDEIKRCVNECGAVICSQSKSLAPADKILYALRDFTSTVDSIPLIASSIMSKKLAAGSDLILLDVKYGSGAFMKTAQSAAELAQAMTEIGQRDGKKCSALITSMQQPLTPYIGCNLEMKSAINVLKGEKNDLHTVSKHISVNLMVMSEKFNREEAESAFDNIIASGAALKRFAAIITSQHGNPDLLQDETVLENGKYRLEVAAQSDGYLSAVDTEAIGKTVLALGGGREKVGGEIDRAAGLVFHRRLNERVKKGDTVATLYTSDKKRLKGAQELIEVSYTLSKDKAAIDKLIYAKVDGKEIVY